ncbi:MAG TPA: adenylate/guanylate cyclase domain-containing protein [Chloroflexota bacterium]
MANVVDDPVRAGIDALRRHSWVEAFELLSQADAEGVLDGSGLEYLADAATWAMQPGDCLNALDRAYCAHLDAGNPRRAAYVALELSREHLAHGRESVSRGWTARAERLLATEPDCVEKGYLLLRKAGRAYRAGDLETMATLARDIVDSGERHDDRDLVGMGMATLGQALLPQGRVEEAMALLDEALAAAVGGELSPGVTALVYCWAIASFRDVADVRRAAEWTDVSLQWCERKSIAGFPGVCRIHRAEIMRLRGAWADAERDVQTATEELTTFSPAMAGEAFGELAMVRVRMGNLSGAEAALERAHELGGETEPARSLTTLYHGDAEGALRCIRDRLSDDTLDRLVRGRMLPAAVQVALAAGAPDEARVLVEELERLADDFGTPLFRAAALQSRGALDVEAGNSEEALRSLRRSFRLWQEIDAPYETAQVRMLMGSAYRSAGSEDAALRELRAAHSCFVRLGARLDAGAAGAAATRHADTSRTTRAFVFTDIVSSTSLIGAIGDDAWRNLVQWHDRTLRAQFTDYEGEEVDHAGDGFFVAFSDAAAALRCAVAIQRRLSEHRRQHGFAPHVRIGVHVSEALQVERSYKGRGVHEAARIGSLAEPDEILASSMTIEAAGIQFGGDTARTVMLKGFTEPVQVGTVRWE